LADPPEEGREIPNLAKGRDIFEEPELQLLWDQGLVEDKSYKRIYDAIATKERTFPP
jgi:hypothetical protein